MNRIANIATQNCIEVNGSVTFGAVTVQDNGETYRNLSISDLGKSYPCRIKAKFLRSLPIPLERTFVKAQLKRIGVTEEWEVLGMLQIPFEDFSKTIKL
jgi:hypothetical protein